MSIEMIAALERVLCIVVAAFFAFLGYRLYFAGLTRGESKLQGKGAFGEFVVSGTGPGLFFMAFGGVVVVYAIATSGIVKSESRTTLPGAAGAAVGAASAGVLPPGTVVETVRFASSAPAKAGE